MLYAAKCFWPGVTQDALRLAAARAADQRETHPRTLFRGALFLPGDELVLCLFESSSRSGVKATSEQAGMPCERVIETVWIDPDATRGEPGCEG